MAANRSESRRPEGLRRWQCEWRTSPRESPVSPVSASMNPVSVGVVVVVGTGTVRRRGVAREGTTTRNGDEATTTKSRRRGCITARGSSGGGVPVGRSDAGCRMEDGRWKNPDGMEHGGVRRLHSPNGKRRGKWETGSLSKRCPRPLTPSRFRASTRSSTTVRRIVSRRSGHRPHHSPGRVRLAPRPLRMRQEHPAADHRRSGTTHRWHGCGERQR